MNVNSNEYKYSSLWGVALFVDIRDFTVLTHKLGAERTLIQINKFYSIVDLVIEKHGGWINNKLGDGVLAFFGFGFQSSKWAKETAIKAALEIQSKVALSKDTKFYVGVGISSGIIAHNDNVFIGEPINFASKLSSIAKGGQVLVCENSKPEKCKEFEVIKSIPVSIKGLVASKLIFSITASSQLLVA